MRARLPHVDDSPPRHVTLVDEVRSHALPPRGPWQTRQRWRIAALRGRAARRARVGRTCFHPAVVGQGDQRRGSIRVTLKTRSPFAVKALSISGVTWNWHVLNHAREAHRAEHLSTGPLDDA